MRSRKNSLGLDIGSSSIKMIQLKETGKGARLDNFAMAPLPPEAIVDGAMMNSSIIVETITAHCRFQFCR